MTPTIIDFADRVAKAPGIEPLTPSWAATLRMLYGLPITEGDADLLEAATGRSREAIESALGQPFEELWARVGRRGRKSSTTALLTAYEAIYGGHSAYTMPGELAIIATISKDLSGAELVRRFQRLYLDALKIRYSETRFGAVAVTLVEGTTTALACMTCTSEAPRGPAIPVAICDEIAFWSTSDNYAEPDKQILAALRPAMAQFPGRKLIGISSPLAKEGVHYDTVEGALRNDSERRILAVQGPTWTWNPTVTEAVTHTLERDPKIWAREYGAIPQDATTAAFETDLIDAAFRADPAGKMCRPILSLDPSGGHGDSFVWTTVQWCIPASGPAVLIVNELSSIDGKFYGTVPLEVIIDKAAKRAVEERAEVAVSDAREELALHSGFTKRNIRYRRIPWTNELKSAAVARLRRLLTERAIVFCPDDTKLKKELYGFVEKILPSGAITYGARRNGHDDRVAVVLTALMAEQEGILPGSPINNRHRPSCCVIATSNGRRDDPSARVTIRSFNLNHDEDDDGPRDVVADYTKGAAIRRARMFNDSDKE